MGNCHCHRGFAVAPLTAPASPQDLIDVQLTYGRWSDAHDTGTLVRVSAMDAAARSMLPWHQRWRSAVASRETLHVTAMTPARQRSSTTVIKLTTLASIHVREAAAGCEEPSGASTIRESPIMQDTACTPHSYPPSLAGGILVADDDGICRQVLARWLAKELPDRAVDMCHDGEDVVNLARRFAPRLRRATSTRATSTPHTLHSSPIQQFDPALVVLDYNMVRSTGATTAQELRELGYRGPIVVMTANMAPDVRAACVNAGVTAVLHKPVTKAHMHTLRAYLNENSHSVSVGSEHQSRSSVVFDTVC